MDGDMRLLTIVGIVGDTHEYGLDAPPRPTVYVNLFQRPRAAMTVTMLSDADTQSGDLGRAREFCRTSTRRFRRSSGHFAGLFRVARFAAIQRHPDRILRHHGAAAGDGRRVRRDGVFGQPPHARDRRARRARAAPGDVLRMILGQGMRTILIGVAIGIAGSFAPDAHRGVAPLRRDGDRSAHIRGCDTLAGGGGAAGLLRSGTARDESRSDGGPAGRVTGH